MLALDILQLLVLRASGGRGPGLGSRARRRPGTSGRGARARAPRRLASRAACRSAGTKFRLLVGKHEMRLSFRVEMK